MHSFIVCFGNSTGKERRLSSSMKHVYALRDTNFQAVAPARTPDTQWAQNREVVTRRTCLSVLAGSRLLPENHPGIPSIVVVDSHWSFVNYGRHLLVRVAHEVALRGHKWLSPETSNGQLARCALLLRRLSHAIDPTAS